MRVLIGFLGLALLYVLTVKTAAIAQEQMGDQETDRTSIFQDLINPDIQIDELAHLLIPLTRDELAPLGQTWLQLVRGKTEEIAVRQVTALRQPAIATDAFHQTTAQLVEERASFFERLTMITNALEDKGGEPELVRELRDYRDAVLFNETLLANPTAIANAALSWLIQPDGGLAVALDLAVVILAFGALLFVARFAKRLVLNWISRVPHISKLLKVFLVSASYWLVFIVGLLLVLVWLGINVTPLFAMIGGASFILAFAFQDTLGNLASGLMIMINRPFDEGDYVVIGGVGGTVKSVSIVATTVNTPDNQVIVIPNKNVWGNIITNVTASDTRRVDLVFGIAYEDSIRDAMQVIETTAAAHPLVLHDPAPVVRVHELGASSVNFICRPWTKTEDYWTVHWDLTHHVKEALTDAGISIPYPQQDVRIKGPHSADAQQQQ